MIRACAQCELEHGLLDRSDESKSHGICKRHMKAWLQDLPEAAAELEDICARIEAGNGFPPDLGPIEKELAA